MSERRDWNSSSSRATTVTVLLPGLRGMSAAKLRCRRSSLGDHLEEDLLVVHEDEDVAQPGGRAAGRDAGRAGQVELLRRRPPAAPLDGIGSEGDAGRLALPDAGDRALALALGRLDVRGRDEAEAPLLPLHLVEVADPGGAPAARPRAPPRRAAAAAGAAPERTGVKRAATLTAPVAGCRAGAGGATGISTFSEMNSSSFSSTTVHAERERVELEPLLHLDLEERRLRVSPGGMAPSTARPFLMKTFSSPRFFMETKVLSPLGAGADVLHVDAQRKRPRRGWIRPSPSALAPRRPPAR